ncbi:MAG TPA: amidase family protein [Novosphingobium sp.]|nr:amidase family protein [Novosphingobium sp.]HNN56719.1 amidase family protein [Novosphingobium sp.]
MIDEYLELDATGMAELVRTGQISAGELAECAIERIEALNPRLNAVIHTFYERGRGLAAKAPAGPFGGVPFLLKDILGDLAGEPTRQGSRIMPPVPAEVNAELTDRFLAAGLVPLGKTNVPEFGLVGTTEPVLYGPAKNPWNTAHSTGGSSGGSACAVAAGMVPVAHANDGGGSIRIPASACGLVGLKPTRARNPLGPMLGDVMGGLVMEHVVCHSVRDAARMLDCTHGPGLGDPYAAPPAPASFAAALEGKGKRLRIGFARTKLNGQPLHGECVAAAEAAARLCESLGHHVEEASPPIDQDQLIVTFMALWTAGLAMQIDHICQLTGQTPSLGNLEGLTFGLYHAGQAVTGAQVLGAQAALQACGRAVAAWHRTYDVWITPVLGTPPIPNGLIDFGNANPVEAFAPMIDYVPFTALQNGTGQPAISLPLHWSADGLPVGVQLVGRVGDEAGLLALSAELEAAAPWEPRCQAMRKAL